MEAPPGRQGTGDGGPPAMGRWCPSQPLPQLLTPETPSSELAFPTERFFYFGRELGETHHHPLVRGDTALENARESRSLGPRTGEEGQAIGPQAGGVGLPL